MSPKILELLRDALREARSEAASLCTPTKRSRASDMEQVVTHVENALLRAMLAYRVNGLNLDLDG